MQNGPAWRPTWRCAWAPPGPVAAGIDPLLRRALRLDAQEFAELVAFVRNGLLDARMLPVHTCARIPASLPSGMALPKFESCPAGPAQ